MTATDGTVRTEVAPTPQIIIERPNWTFLHVPIVGTTPLIMHRFSEKAKRKMLDEMQGRKTPKEPKDPEQEYRDAMYLMDDGDYCYPALAFKDATVGAARDYGRNVKMTELKQWLWFIGERGGNDDRQMIRIYGEPRMREDYVRVGRGGTDLRYRPEFLDWRAELVIRYNPALLTSDSVLALIETGGQGLGVGDWRPEKGGDSGTYQIDQSEKIEIVGA